ncbi:unnamed protein product [Ilex paraguariensis]|uniref:Transmembrane protein n=1 Tax=Ilex paraguariensis TaxID=185542 RepID=A0ABC8RSF6_9AQUA
MATESSPLPEEQQSQDTVPNPEAVSSSAASGSIGPFFAVISVLTVLAILSCILSRICKRRVVTPLESIKHVGCFRWLKRRCSRCVAGDEGVSGEKAMVHEKESNGGKALDGV